MYHQYPKSQEQMEKESKELFLRRLIDQVRTNSSKAHAIIEQGIIEQDRHAIRRVILYEMRQLEYDLPDDEWIESAVDYCLAYLTSSSQSK